MLLATTGATRGMAANPPAPFNQCPAVGLDTACAILIVIQPDGSLTVLADATQRPFDGGDDTLLGVVNDSGITVPSISIGSSTQVIFGFEASPGQDGLCHYTFAGSGYCTATPTPPTGYEGPDTTFANISANKRDGTVRFTDSGGGLPAGASTFFSLENAITATRLSTGAATSLAFTAASATGSDNADVVTVGATLHNGAAAVAGATVTFTLAPGPTSVSCTATTTATGQATCSLAPDEAAATYTLTASYAGSSVPFLAPVNTSAPFIVTLEQDTLAYTGTTSGMAGEPAQLSAVLTTDDPAAATPLAGRTVRLTLGSGPGAPACSGLTDTSGTATCMVIVPASQAPGTLMASAVFASDTLYVAATATGTVAVSSGTVAVPTVGTGPAVPWPAAALLVVGAGLLAARRRRG